MNIKLQKRNYSALRKLTKVDENNNVIEGQDELFVRVEDVPSNLLNDDATALSEEVFEKINWIDNKVLLFTQTEALPEPISGLTQIVSLENGQIWCVPGSNVPAFKLGADDLALYLKKNFQTYEGVTVLGSTTKIGALPADFTTNGNASTSTYLDINDGNIAFKITGAQKHLLNDEKVSFTHGNGEICINDTEVALKHHSDKTTIGLVNGSFYIKGNNTQISEDLTNNKLNFYTNLANAVYGNSAIYLEFYPSLVRFKNANGGELLSIKTDGSIYANSSNRVIDSSIIDNYIKTYFDNYFEENFLACYNGLSNVRNVFFEGFSQSIAYDISDDSALFQINFSDTSDGTIMTIYFNGSNINNLDKVYKCETGCYYQICQTLDTSDSEYYIKVKKYQSADANNSNTVYIRGLYRF